MLLCRSSTARCWPQEAWYWQRGPSGGEGSAVRPGRKHRCPGAPHGHTVLVANRDPRSLFVCILLLSVGPLLVFVAKLLLALRPGATSWRSCGNRSRLYRQITAEVLHDQAACCCPLRVSSPAGQLLLVWRWRDSSSAIGCSEAWRGYSAALTIPSSWQTCCCC